METYAEGLRAKKTKKIPHVCSADRVVSDTGVPRLQPRLQRGAKTGTAGQEVLMPVEHLVSSTSPAKSAALGRAL